MASAKKNKRIESKQEEHMPQTLEEALVELLSDPKKRETIKRLLNNVEEHPISQQKLKQFQVPVDFDEIRRMHIENGDIELTPGNWISKYDVLAGEWVHTHGHKYLTRSTKVMDFMKYYLENKHQLHMSPKDAYENAEKIASGELILKDEMKRA